MTPVYSPVCYCFPVFVYDTHIATSRRTVLLIERIIGYPTINCQHKKPAMQKTYIQPRIAPLQVLGENCFRHPVTNLFSDPNARPSQPVYRLNGVSFIHRKGVFISRKLSLSIRFIVICRVSFSNTPFNTNLSFAGCNQSSL
jgi:hypothetical protein